MPCSRVCVMPETTPSSFEQKHSQQDDNIAVRGSRRSNRSKGITMEYLKRQTALRLALEQSVETSPTQDGHAGQLYSSQKSSSNKAYSSSIPMATPSQNTQSFSLQQEHVTAVATTYSKNKTTSLIDTSSEHDYLYSGVNNYDPNYIQSQYQNIDASGYSGETPIMRSNYTSNYTHGPLIDSQTMICTAQHQLPPSSNMCVSPNNMQYQSSLPTSHQYAQLPSTGRHNIINMSKHILPHGLTVYELKEMTKARLQSEAAEKINEGVENQTTPRDRGVSPLDFDSVESARENTNCSLASAGVYMSKQDVAPNTLQTQQQSSFQVYSSGYNPSNTIGGGAVPQSFRMTAPAGASRSDTWESTSVVSHNSTIYSDNIGSESTSEVGSFGHCNGNRNRSFTYPAVQVHRLFDGSNTSNGCKSTSNPSSTQASPHGNTGGVIGAPPSLFNAAVGGNRQRAVTLSPNTRPFTCETLRAGDRLEIPNFNFAPATSGTSSSVAPHIRTNQRGYSPVLHNLGLDDTYLCNGTRPSGVFRNVASNNSSLLRVSPVSQTGPTFHGVTKNNSFFLGETASSETRIPAPPPGFSTSNASSNNHTAFSRVGSVDSVPMSNSSTNGKKYWGQISDNQYNRSHVDSEDNITNHFTSILDLSGSMDRPDRERASTYTFGSSSLR